MKPEQAGFVFQPVREQAIQASNGPVDFGFLFLGFSFFLIAAALLLVGLLVRLNLDRRANEVGLLLATGWDNRRVRRLLLAEGAVLTIIGSLIGLGAAMVYAQGMLKLLVANWPGGNDLNFLRVHVSALSFVIGGVLSLTASMATLWWATRSMSKLSPRSLLSGETTSSPGLADAKAGWSWWLMPIGVAGALALAVSARFIPSHEAQAGTFLGSGALLLTAALAAVWHAFKRFNRDSSPQPTLGRLGFRNAARHAARSVLTVGLLASASFLIVAVESFHKDTGQHFHDKTGGSGGFAFYAEGNISVREDLNQPDVRHDHGLDTPEWRRTVFFGCRVQPGDDASCLGLYKPLKPRVMGVSRQFIERGGFSFAKTEADSDDEKANPWLLLNRKSGDEIPAIIDKNTSEWVLKAGVGESIDVVNERANRKTTYRRLEREHLPERDPRHDANFSKAVCFS